MQYLGFMIFIALCVTACGDEQGSLGSSDSVQAGADAQVVIEQVEQKDVVASSNGINRRPGMRPRQATNLDQAALLKKGKIVFLRCRSCHSLEQDGASLTGPNLYGLFGAVAGKKEGYVFSTKLSESGIVWDEQTLDEWVRNPQELIAGNKMAFMGLPDATNRKAVIAYLKEHTK